MEGIRERLLAALSGWTLENQLASIADTVCMRQVANGAPESNYECTDRELNALGIIVALGEFEDSGELIHRFPSGAVVYLDEDAQVLASAIRVEGQVQVEDLPDFISDWISRMPSHEQHKRERQLAASWPAVEAERKRHNLPHHAIRKGASRQCVAEQWREHMARYDWYTWGD